MPRSKPLRSTITRVIGALEACYGPQPWRSWGNPLDGLIGTVLSQHTSDVNSDAAFRSLKRAFPTWKACMTAPAASVERAIRSGGLARQKTRSIQAILRAIQADRGRLSLEFLRRRPMNEARSYLLAMPGVGPKTAACVLLFYLGRPALPVDTHVYRVAWRLGLIPENATAEDAHRILEPACPPRQVYAFHILLIRHGRQICKARNPRCRECVLARLCPSAVIAG